ncbi:MAG: hypothetical protein DMF76_20930 [Acidobacteria bacterium]|nr:MAG: hypothetical protein DMF76_20930 [Acidobacteriota bacterium]
MNRVITKQQRDRSDASALGAMTLICFLIIGLNACSFRSPTPANMVRTSNVYDYAKANDWKNADVKVAALRDVIKKVRTNVKNQSAAVDRLDTNVAALERAVTAKDRQAAMQTANQVTLDVANMTTAYKLSVPVEVTKLDYYGRELEVWAQAKDANKLQTTTREMRQTWDSLRPTIAAKSAAEAKKFDALVAQVELAKTSADYQRVAKPVLDEVDNLEKLFQ